VIWQYQYPAALPLFGKSRYFLFSAFVHFFFKSPDFWNCAETQRFGGLCIQGSTGIDTLMSGTRIFLLFTSNHFNAPVRTKKEIASTLLVLPLWNPTQKRIQKKKGGDCFYCSLVVLCARILFFKKFVNIRFFSDKTTEILPKHGEFSDMQWMAGTEREDAW